MKLSIPAKAVATATVVLGVVAPLQLWLVSRWSSEERTIARLALVFVAPYAFYILASGLFAHHIVHGRTRRLTRVLDAIATGDLRSELPGTLDTDLTVVRDSLLSMRAALDELTTRLRHTDGQRRRLFADLAHELATPTTTILGIAEVFLDPELPSPEADRVRLARALDTEASRLGRLIGDIRDLARLDDPDIALAPAEVDIGELARHATERVNLAAPDRRPIEITTEVVPPIRVDPQRIDQILMNLLSNARRYTPPDSAIHVAVAVAASGVRITVEDGGQGVPDEALPHLGERLFRVDPSRTARTGGSGLGLSIVAAVVQRHAGTLRFERATLGGLRVVVELPGSP